MNPQIGLDLPSGPPLDVDVLPAIGDDLEGLTGRFYLWNGWGSRPSLVRLLRDGEWLAVVQMTFTWALLTGRIGNRTICTNRWCYESLRAALAAAAVWDGSGEPIGWIKHPQSGRFRAGGDPAKEEII